MSERILIIDGNALIHRAYHAIPPTMRTATGEPTNAVYGFASSLISALETLKPTYVAVTFDPPGQTFRHAEYSEYKAHRQKADDGLYQQLDRARELVTALGLPIYEQPGYEADDAIGTIAKRLEDQPVEIVIASGDKDALQLLSPQVKVWTLKQGIKEAVLYDEAALKAERGLTPEGFLFAKALRGDPSDNIPGVAGVGEKTANLIAALWPTPEELEKVLNKLPETELKAKGLSPKLQAKLKESADLIRKSYFLVSIACDVPLDFKLEDAKFKPALTAEAEKLFRELEFSSLLRHLYGLVQGESSLLPSRDNARRQTYTQVTKANWPEVLAGLKKQTAFAVDTETDSLVNLEQRLVGASLSWQSGQAYYLPFQHDEGPNLPVSALKELAAVLADSSRLKIGHNLKYDLHTFANEGIEVAGPYFDTMVAAHILAPDRSSVSLDECSLRECGEQLQPISELIGSGAKQITMRQVAVATATAYAAEDADFTWRLYEIFAPRLKEANLQSIFTDIEMPLLPVLFQMERRGILLDTEELNRQGEVLKADLKKVEAKIIKLAGVDFNVASPDQLADVLFNKLKISALGLRRKASRPSTAAAELEKIKHSHPIVALIQEYREKAKLISTYIDALPALLDKKDHRLHTTFSQTIASTGRLSSMRPNLQNIPIRTEDGRAIRRAFVAAPKKVLLSADYSQIELRLAAHLSGDEAMIRAFTKGQDLHTETAAQIFTKPEAEVTPEERRIAKAINFSLMYGVTAFGLAEYIGKSRAEAAEFIERYFAHFPGVRRYIEQTIALAHKRGYAETMLGYRLPLPDLENPNQAARSAAERLALNLPAQGSQAEILKEAMIKLGNLPGADLLLSVHDELVFEVAPSDIPKLSAKIKQAMENIRSLSVPLIAELKTGRSWGEMTPIEEL